MTVSGILRKRSLGTFAQIQKAKQEVASTSQNALCKRLCRTCLLHFWSVEKGNFSHGIVEFGHGIVMLSFFFFFFFFFFCKLKLLFTLKKTEVHYMEDVMTYGLFHFMKLQWVICWWAYVRYIYITQQSEVVSVCYRVSIMTESACWCRQLGKMYMTVGGWIA